MTKKKGLGQHYRNGLSLPQLIRAIPRQRRSGGVVCRWPYGPSVSALCIQIGAAHKIPYRGLASA